MDCVQEGLVRYVRTRPLLRPVKNPRQAWLFASLPPSSKVVWWLCNGATHKFFLQRACLTGS